MDHRNTEARRCLRHLARANGVHREGQVRLVLGLVDSGVGGGRNDDVRTCRRQRLEYGLGPRQVERRPADGDHLHARDRARHLAQAGSDLALASGDDKPHAAPFLSSAGLSSTGLWPSRSPA